MKNIFVIFSFRVSISIYYKSGCKPRKAIHIGSQKEGKLAPFSSFLLKLFKAKSWKYCGCKFPRLATAKYLRKRNSIKLAYKGRKSEIYWDSNISSVLKFHGFLFLDSSLASILTNAFAQQYTSPLVLLFIAAFLVDNLRNSEYIHYWHATLTVSSHTPSELHTHNITKGRIIHPTLAGCRYPWRTKVY